MFETEGAKELPAEKIDIDPQAEVRQIRVWLDEYPDRNTYIHGLCLDGP